MFVNILLNSFYVRIYFAVKRALKQLMVEIETFAAIAASAYSQGADKIYFFNYFRNIIHDPLTDDIECSEDTSLPFMDKRIYKTVISKLGSFEDTLTLNRHHIITIKDRLPLWKRNTNYAAEKRTENRAANQLPLRFNRDGSFKLAVGKIPEGAEVTLRFAVDDHDAALASLPRVFVNSEACDYIGDVDDPRWYPEGKLLCYNIPQTAYKDIICPYIIVSGETLMMRCNLSFLEIKLKIVQFKENLMNFVYVQNVENRI